MILLVSALLQDKRANLKTHIEKSSKDHLNKIWSAFLKTKYELSEVKGNVEEMQVCVKTLQSEKEENMSLKSEITEMGRKLEKVKESAASENTLLKGVVQTMKRKLEVLEKEITELKVKESKMPVLVITWYFILYG